MKKTWKPVEKYHWQEIRSYKTGHSPQSELIDIRVEGKLLTVESSHYGKITALFRPGYAICKLEEE